MIDLRQIVQRYSVLTGKSGEPVSLEKFGMNQQETEKVFSELDEDYHISRFLHFSLNDGPAYQISGEAVTHVAIDAAIRLLL